MYIISFLPLAPKVKNKQETSFRTDCVPANFYSKLSVVGRLQGTRNGTI